MADVERNCFAYVGRRYSGEIMKLSDQALLAANAMRNIAAELDRRGVERYISNRLIGHAHELENAAAKESEW